MKSSDNNHFWYWWEVSEKVPVGCSFLPFNNDDLSKETSNHLTSCWVCFPLTFLFRSSAFLTCFLCHQSDQIQGTFPALTLLLNPAAHHKLQSVLQLWPVPLCSRSTLVSQHFTSELHLQLLSRQQGESALWHGEEEGGVPGTPEAEVSKPCCHHHGTLRQLEGPGETVLLSSVQLFIIRNTGAHYNKQPQCSLMSGQVCLQADNVLPVCVRLNVFVKINISGACGWHHQHLHFKMIKLFNKTKIDLIQGSL